MGLSCQFNSLLLFGIQMKMNYSGIIFAGFTWIFREPQGRTKIQMTFFRSIDVSDTLLLANATCKKSGFWYGLSITLLKNKHSCG